MSRVKLNLEEMKLIVAQFQGGRSMSTLAWVYGVEVDVIEQVIRQVMNTQKRPRTEEAKL